MSGAVNIGEFRLSGGRHFQMNRQEGTDAVHVDRQHPAPEKGRNVARAWSLDEAEPRFRFPFNWTREERHHARVSIGNAWKRHREQERQAAEAAEEAKKAEQVVPDEDDSYLEWYVGEYYLFKTVFTVFRLQSRPGWFKVSGFDGKQNSEVCEFTMDRSPAWSKGWRDATRRHDEIAAQARRIVKRPSRE